MKTIIKVIATISLLVLSQASYAQDHEDYLQKAWQRLLEGDCSRAQLNYNVYVQLTEKTDAELEKKIQDCYPMGASRSIEPFTLNYLFGKDSYNVNIQENKESRRILLDKIESGGIITGFKIQVWVGPLSNHLAKNYANAVEMDVKTQLKRCQLNPDNYLFESIIYEVDWDAFLFFVENTALNDKYAIMNALNNSDDREATLETLLEIYPDFEKEIMPLLRKAQVYVY